MPVSISNTVRPVSQDAFGELAYRVIAKAFEIHQRLGPLFRESVYRSTLAHLIADAVVEELKIVLTHKQFRKELFVDLLVDESGPFELKVVETLTDKHRSQLMQYLMLLGLFHGKLINFGADSLEHEFVNCNTTQEQRRSFEVVRYRWGSEQWSQDFETSLVELLRDWGTGLQRSLYTEAVSALIPGEHTSLGMVSTHWNGTPIQTQPCQLISETVAWTITCQSSELDRYRRHLNRLLANTQLRGILWANVTLGTLRLEEISHATNLRTFTGEIRKDGQKIVGQKNSQHDPARSLPIFLPKIRSLGHRTVCPPKIASRLRLQHSRDADVTYRHRFLPHVPRASVPWTHERNDGQKNCWAKKFTVPHGAISF